MPRIQPVDPATTEGKAHDLLSEIQSQFGMIPNLMKTLAQAPAALEGYLNFNEALSGGTLCPLLREQVAVAVAGINQCGYCASAHTAIGKKVGLDGPELGRNLQGQSGDPKIHAALQFVKALVDGRGHILEEELLSIRDAGFSDTEIVEIVAHVGLNIFTNYFNNVTGTAIDFPVVDVSKTVEA